MRAVLSLLCALSFFSCGTIRQLPAPAPPPKTSEQRFAEDCTRLLSDSISAGAQTGIKIVSLSRGDVLFELSAGKLFHPGSNTKLFTSALALCTLGKDFKFRTQLYADSSAGSSSAPEALYLRGSGDPDLTSDDLREMIASLRAEGIKEIDGDLVGDVAYFDDREWGAGWMWDDDPADYAMHLSVLSLNKNSVKVTVNPGPAAGAPVSVHYVPPTRYVTVQNQALTGADSSDNTLRVTRPVRPEQNIIQVSGSLPVTALPYKITVNVWQPELYALTVMKELLVDSSIPVTGTVWLGTVPDGCRLVAEHTVGLDTVLARMNRTSDNLAAENILKTIAAERRKEPGSTAGGLSELNRWLMSVGIDSTRQCIVDGSGLSEYNLVTPGTLIELLKIMHQKGDTGEVFRSTLPVAGRSGTLHSRMKGTAADSSAFAKTGTLTAASALSGYAKAANGEILAFSIMMQHYLGSPQPFRAIQDSLVIRMCKFTR